MRPSLQIDFTFVEPAVILEPHALPENGNCLNDLNFMGTHPRESLDGIPVVDCVLRGILVKVKVKYLGIGVIDTFAHFTRHQAESAWWISVALWVLLKLGFKFNYVVDIVVKEPDSFNVAFNAIHMQFGRATYPLE